MLTPKLPQVVINEEVVSGSVVVIKFENNVFNLYAKEDKLRRVLATCTSARQLSKYAFAKYGTVISDYDLKLGDDW